MEQLLALLPTILKIADRMPELMQIVSSLGKVGKDLFPTVPDDKATDAGATVVDQTGTKWTQTALNLLGAMPKLTVDGSYGPATRDAVMKFQQAHPPLVADGWAGKETARILQEELAKH